jgi:hypothetical protein
MAEPDPDRGTVPRHAGRRRYRLSWPSLWRPALHHAFPAGTSRPYVDSWVGELHAIRNRVAHHEPLIAFDVQKAHRSLSDIAALLSPDLAAHLQARSHLTRLLGERP